MERCRIIKAVSVCGAGTCSLLRKGIFSALMVLFLTISASASAATKGRLAGMVYEFTTGKPVAKVLVAIQGTRIATLTNKEGRFHFDLEEGTFSISLFKEGYYNTCYQDISVERGRVTTYKCELVPGDPSQSFFFSIGGITVFDKRDLLPREIETTHEITSAEIEHNLSTNLGDILDIIPGAERTKAPGLSEKTQVSLRGTSNISGSTERTAALFGTKILIDDITISNNANLQSGTGTSFGETSTYAGSGIDLRTIPADNIEKVEVITGVPSVEYGDFTSGLVKVKTKMGKQPHRIKTKSNPDTKETNLSGGWNMRGTGISYNLNYAYSERSIRRKGDEYSRYSGQFTFRNKFWDENLSILNKFYYTGVMDETDMDVNDPISVHQYNKDKKFLYGQTINYKPTKETKIEWRANIRYTIRDSYYQRLTGADNRVLSDAMEPGTNEGVFKTGAYIFKIWTKGEEWNVGAKLNLKADFGLFSLTHSALMGGEYTFDDNVGEGKIFDPLEPPYGKLGYRPFPFDAAPGLHTANFYLEDKISGFLWMKPYVLNAGFRYEMYSPHKLHLDGLFKEKGIIESKNGTYLNPRIRFKFGLFEDTQIRFGWGMSSKMPSMNTIFKAPEYIDIVEENVTPPDSVPLVSTYVFSFDNRNLKGYQQEKMELSLDQKIGNVGLILTGFYSKSDEIPRATLVPITLCRYRWNDWPNSAGTAIDTLYETWAGSNYINKGWYKKHGIEFQLLTRRIKKLSTKFRITSSYIHSRSGSDGAYISNARFNNELGRTIYPIYKHADSGWRRKMIVNYSADWAIKKLGLWVTFFLQQTLFDADINCDNPISYAAGYYDPTEGKKIWITPGRSTELGLDRFYEEDDLIVQKRPNDRFLFNINVSKSLGRGAEISMFVHNLFDDRAYYMDEYGNWRSRNHAIFYGVEFSMILDDLWRNSTHQEEIQ